MNKMDEAQLAMIIDARLVKGCYLWLPEIPVKAVLQHGGLMGFIAEQIPRLGNATVIPLEAMIKPGHSG
ncbi:hypothetical protein [Levilactobacillus cerevisiae]|uniref:hypothetical protein n=1 Tax=Levilactobacillus cerevisiae TaxID=1704076 RepID=UPI000F77E63D|nr:hypothetical protein [Levilactobacillus cerevisiae]